MSTPRNAPLWALPFLSAYLVATSRPHALRRLPDKDFRRIARAFDCFLAVTTIPGLLAGFALIAHTAGLALFIGTCIWGMVAIMTIGRRVALERGRRASTPKAK